MPFIFPHFVQRGLVVSGCLILALTLVVSAPAFAAPTPGETAVSPPVGKSEAAATAGRIQGTFQTGGLSGPEDAQGKKRSMKVRVRADLEKDQPLADRVAAAVGDLPTFQIAGADESIDLLLLIRRRPADGPPRCWIMTPGGNLYHDNLVVDLSDIEAGIDVISGNMGRIEKIRDLTAPSPDPDRVSPVAMLIAVWEPAPEGGSGEIEVEGKKWRKVTTITAQGLAKYDLKVDQLLTFTLINTDNRPYFTYLIDIAPDGEIIPFFPTPFQGEEYGRIKPGELRPVKAVTLIMDKPGNEHVRLIASPRPLDIYQWGQSGYGKGLDNNRQSGVESSPKQSITMERR